MFYRARFVLAKVIGYAICEPQIRLGRRRHNGHCDECGDCFERYAAEKLRFPLDDLSADASSSAEKLRAMINAEYMRVCLQCSTELESGQPSDSENSTGTEGENR